MPSTLAVDAMISNRAAVLLYFVLVTVFSAYSRDATPLLLSGVAFLAYLIVDSMVTAALRH